jgi:hypothetical protein
VNGFELLMKLLAEEPDLMAALPAVQAKLNQVTDDAIAFGKASINLATSTKQLNAMLVPIVRKLNQ